MIKFTEIKWLKWWLRARPFGSHMKATAYVPSGTVITFTPRTEMMNFSFRVGASVWWLRNRSYAVLTDAEGNEYPLFGYVTKSGNDPAVRPKGYWIGRERDGLPMGTEMFLTVHGSRKVRLTYAGAILK